MGNRLKKLIMFLVVVLGMTLFANEEQKAPNEIIKDNPEREVTTVESMKVRDHATMSLSVTKVKEKVVEGVLEGGRLNVTLPVKGIASTSSDKSNKIATPKEEKTLIVESKSKSSGVAMLRRATPDKNITNKFPTQEEMDNLTPEKIKAMLKEGKKVGKTNTIINLDLNTKNYTAKEIRDNLAVEIYDVNKNENIYLNVVENGQVLDRYLVSANEKIIPRATHSREYSGFLVGKTIGVNTSRLKLLNKTNSEKRIAPDSVSRVRKVDMTLKVKEPEFVFNDDFLGKRYIKTFAEKSTELVGFGFKINYISQNIPPYSLFILPEAGTETMIKKDVNSSEGFKIEDLETRGQSGLDYQDMMNKGGSFVVKTKNGKAAYDSFKSLVLREDNYLGFHSLNLTGGIASINMTIDMPISDSQVEPGLYEYTGEFITTDYLDYPNNSSYIKAIVKDMKLDLSDKADGVIGTNGFKLADDRNGYTVGTEELVTDEKPVFGKEYAIPIKNSRNRMSYMYDSTKHPQKAADAGLYIYVNNENTPIKLTNNMASQEFTYKQVTTTGQQIDQKFKVKVSQGVGEWVKVFFIPTKLTNPLSALDVPKVEFKIAQGRKQGSGIVEYRKVNYIVKTERVGDESIGTVNIQIDPRFYYQKLGDNWLDLTGKVGRSLDNLNQNYTDFVRTKIYGEDEVTINNITKLGGEGISFAPVSQSSVGKYSLFYKSNSTNTPIVALPSSFKIKDFKNTPTPLVFKQSVMNRKESQAIRIYYKVKDGTVEKEIFLRNELEVIPKLATDQYFEKIGYTGNGFPVSGDTINFDKLSINDSRTLVIGKINSGAQNEIALQIVGYQPIFNGMVEGKEKEVLGTHYRVTVDGVVQNGSTNQGYVEIGRNTTILNGHLTLNLIKNITADKTDGKKIITLTKKSNNQYPAKDIIIDYYYKKNGVEVQLGQFKFSYSNISSDLPSAGDLVTRVDSRLTQLQNDYPVISLNGKVGNFDANGNFTSQNSNYSNFSSTEGNVQSNIAIEQGAYDYIVNMYDMEANIKNHNGKMEYYDNYIGGYYGAKIRDMNTPDGILVLQNKKINNISDIKTNDNFLRRMGIVNGYDLFTKMNIKVAVQENIEGTYDKKKLPFTHDLIKVSANRDFDETNGYQGSGVVDFSRVTKDTICIIVDESTSDENLKNNELKVTNQVGWLPVFTSLVKSKDVATHYTVNKGGRVQNPRNFIDIDRGQGQNIDGFLIKLIRDNTSRKKHLQITKKTGQEVDTENIYIEYYNRNNGKNIKLGEFVLHLKNAETVTSHGSMVTKVDARLEQVPILLNAGTFEEYWITLEGKMGRAIKTPNTFKNYSKLVYTDRTKLNNKTITGEIAVKSGNKYYEKLDSVTVGGTGNKYLKFGPNRNSGNDLMAIKDERIDLKNIGGNQDILSEMRFARKTKELKEYIVEFRAGDKTKGSFSHTFEIVNGGNDFTPLNGYIGSGSLNLTGVNIGEEKTLIASNANAENKELKLNSLNGTLPNIKSLVNSGVIADKYIVSVAETGNNFIKIKEEELTSNTGVDILNGKYSIRLANVAEKNLKITKKSDDTIPGIKVKIEYYNEIETNHKIKLGEFILSLTNTETITDLGVIRTVIDPRMGQLYEEFKDTWISTSSNLKRLITTRATSRDISDFIYVGNELNNDNSVTIGKVLEVSNGNGKYTEENSNIGGYSIFINTSGEKVYGVKLGNSISKTALGTDTFARKYEDTGDLIVKFQNNNTKYKLMHTWNNLSDSLNQYFTISKGYIGSGEVDLTKESVGETYTLTNVSKVGDDSIAITNSEGYLPNFNRIVTSASTTNNIADGYTIKIGTYGTEVNKSFNDEVDIGNGSLKLMLTDTGILKIKKIKDETIPETTVLIKYYSNYSGGKIQLGQYTLKIKNNGDATENGSIVTKVDPRIKQLNTGNYLNYWISTGGYASQRLANFGNTSAPKYLELIDTTLTNISSSTISKVISIAKSNGVIYQKVSNNSIVNSYTKYENDSSDPYKDVFGIRIGNNISKAKDNHGTIARKYKDNTNGILTIKYLEGMGDKTTKKSFTHTLTIENGPSSNFTADVGYSGSGTVDLSNKRVGKYKIVKPISTKNTAPTDLPLESLNGVLPNINSLATKAPIATHYSVDNGVNYTALGTETEVEVGKLKITLDTDGNIILNKLKDDKVTEDSVTIDYFYFSDKDDTNSTKIKLGSFTLNISDSMFELDTANQALDFGTMFYDSRDGKVNHVKRTQKFTLKAHGKEVDFRVADNSEMTITGTNNKIDLIDVKVTKKSNTEFELGATAVLDETTASGIYNGEIQVIVDITTPSNP